MNHLFTVLFLVLVALAAVHFIYEAIILPSIRMANRFKLFALRDRLRALRLINGIAIDDEAFNALDSSLSWQIENQHRLTFSLARGAEKHYSQDEQFRAEVDRRVAVINACQSHDFVSIRQEAANYMANSIGWNGGVLLLFLVPPIGAIFCMHRIIATSVQIVALPEGKLEKLAVRCA